MARNGQRRAVFLSVTCLGISSIVTQIVALREFLNLFAGNELVVALILGNWLLLTGLGSYLGRWSGRIREPIRWLVMCQAALALVPACQITAIRLAKSVVPFGLMLGLGQAFLGSFLILLPYCLVSGFLLTLFSRMISVRNEPGQIGEVYVLDVAGDIIGGVLFSFFLVHYCTPFQVAAIVLVLNFLAASVLAFRGRRQLLGGGIVLLWLVSLTVFWRYPLEQRTAQAMFPGLELVRQQSTPYGHVAVTRQGGQTTIYENGLPVGSTGDPVAAEEIVHYALSQHPNPKSVLLVSGGLTGALQELKKYALGRVDYVELDPAVLELVRTALGPKEDFAWSGIAQDARRFIKASRGQYDALLMSLPDPSSAQLNRFYTVEFFSEVKRALREGGVFSFGLSRSENYANPEARLLASAVHRSLSAVFTNVLLVPGERLFFVAADHPLDYRIGERLKEKGVHTEYVHADYLAANLAPDRIAAARKMVAVAAPVNRDFFPVSYYAHLQHWLRQFGGSLLLPTLLILGVGLLIGVFVASAPGPRVSLALSTSGFGGMGLEVVLLIAFQVSYGYVFRQIGWIMTSFLLGSAIGAALLRGFPARPRRRMLQLDLFLAGVAFLLAPALQWVHRSESLLLQTLVPTLFFSAGAALVGFGVGAQFPVAAQRTFDGVERTAGHLYAVDLLGACLGALVVGTFLIPWLGVAATCYLIGALKLASAAGLIWEGPVPQSKPVPLPRVSSGPVINFGIVLLVLSTLGILIVAEDTRGWMYSISMTPLYHGLVLVLVGFGILQAMGMRGLPAGQGRAGPDVGTAWRRWSFQTGARLWRWLYYLGFSLVVFFPIFRCYFKVPYLFCHVCPRPCVFGVLRPYLVPAALIMNLEKRHWCFQACPIGTLYHCQMRAGAGSARPWPRWLRWVPLLVLAGTAVTYFKLKWDWEMEGGVVVGEWYAYLMNNVYAVSAAVLASAGLLILLGFRLRRTFCEALCPVGTLSELLLKGERSLILGEGRAGSETGTPPAAERPEPDTRERPQANRPDNSDDA